MGKLVQGRSKNIDKKTKKAVSTIIPKQPGSQYTNEQRRAVIVDYLVTGNISKTADMNNMPRTTVTGWIDSDWGHELLVTIRQEKEEELDANLTNLVVSSFEQAQDRIDNGDFRLVKTKKAIKHEDGSLEVSEDYELKRVPMGGKELVISGGVGFDKRRLHRNQATQIHGQSADSQIKDAIAGYLKLYQRNRVVSTQENCEVAK